MNDLVGAQCGAVIGLHPQDDEWRSGKRMAGVDVPKNDPAVVVADTFDGLEAGEYEILGDEASVNVKAATAA